MSFEIDSVREIMAKREKPYWRVKAEVSIYKPDGPACI
jgi:hypothetical protein